MDETKDAIADADRALALNKKSGKAIVAKAEALYRSGNFEKALVQFVRAGRIDRTVGASEGARRAKRAIFSVLDRSKFCFNNESLHAYLDVNNKLHMKGQCHQGKRKIKTANGLILEEERFLLSLKNIESLNVRIRVKVGTKQVHSEVNTNLLQLSKLSQYSGCNKEAC